MASLTTTASIPAMTVVAGRQTVASRRSLTVCRAAKGERKPEPAKSDGALAEGRRAVVLAAAATAVSAVGRSAAAGPSTLAGGWKKIDVSDPHVQELGSWAVAEHNKQAGEQLQFRKVVSGEDQVVAGLNYRLVLDAADGGAGSGKYETVVYEQEWTQTRRLTSFKPST